MPEGLPGNAEATGGDERRIRVLMVGPRGGRGGIASVLDDYEATGFPAPVEVTTVTSTSGTNAASKVLSFARAISRIALGLVRREWDLAHLHSSQGMSLVRKALVAGLCRTGGIPVIVHAHGSRFDEVLTRGPGWRRRLAHLTLSRADTVITLSDEWLETLRRLVPSGTFVVVQNGVPIPEERAALEGNLVVATGLLGERKGSYTLVRSIAKLPEARASLAGNGEVAGVRSEAERLGVSDRVLTPGWIGPEDRARLLGSAAVYALPSQAEGLPIGLLEAMSFGLAVVATPVGGIPGLITHGENGMLVEPDDPDALASTLGELLADSQTRLRLGANARRTIERSYTTRISIEKLVGIYGNVLSGS